MFEHLSTSSISSEEYARICEYISSRPDIVADLTDFYCRWTEVNEGDDPNAFAYLPKSLPDITSILIEGMNSGRLPIFLNPPIAALSIIGRYIADFVEQA